MKNFIILFVKIFIIATICITPLALINLKVDPYGIFRKNFNDQFMEPNQQFIKMEYILKNPEKYTNFLFGSSRVGYIETSKISDNFYNMTYSQGLPSEFLININTLIKHKIKIDCIMLGLDEFSFRLDPETHKNNFLFTPYEDKFFTDNFFKIKYLLNPINPNYITAYRQRNEREFPPMYDIYGCGWTYNPSREKYLNENPELHMNDPRFDNPAVHTEERYSQTLTEITEIVDLCKKNNIKLIVFFNPPYKTTYLKNNPERFENFKKDLSKYTEFYDFSGINSVTEDKMNYYEYSHYRPHVGDMIMERIFQMGNCFVPSDFGYFISKND